MIGGRKKVRCGNNKRDKIVPKAIDSPSMLHLLSQAKA
jgi:hypothetical protein